MLKILLACMGFLLICPSSLIAQRSPLVLSMDQPKVHRKIGFQYTGELAKMPAVTSILYYSVADRVYAQALGNATVGDKLLGSFTLPDSAQAFALVFKKEKQIDDNNDKGYVFNIYKDNLPILGTYASKAVFYSHMAGLIAVKRDDNKATALYEKEFSRHPDQKEIYGDNYIISGLHSADKEEVLKRLQVQWNQMMQRKAPDDSLMHLYNLLSNFDHSQVKTYNEQLLTLYPHGILSAKNAAAKVYAMPVADSMVVAYHALLKNYPELEPDKILNQQQFHYIVARKYLEKKDYDNFQKFADKVKMNNMRSSLYNSAAWPLAESGNKDSLNLAAQLAKKSVSAALAMKEDCPSYYTKQNWDAVCQSNYAMVADTYAYILFQQGNITDALQLQQKALVGLQSDPDMNMRLVKYLLASGDDVQALSKATSFIQAGKSNPELVTLSKEAYSKVNNSDSGYAASLAKWQQSAKQTQIKEVKKSMINVQGYSFSLKDLKGETISLEDLKGKVVIVDFWATWCGPCKMSFPGMQLALDKYKDDPEVVFLFVDTWEKQPTMKERITDINEVIGDGQYTFRVLLDTPKDEEKSAYHTVSAYEVTGIPTKFVLDKNGHIRFKAVGFNGNSQQLADDLSMMIELAKKG